MRFHTLSGSAYEVDLKERKIRRLSGAEDPTPRQGKDGEWKGYEQLNLEVGSPACIIWDPKTTPRLEGNPFMMSIPATVTSDVVSILEDDIN